MTKQTNILAQTAKTTNSPQRLTRAQLVSVTGGVLYRRSGSVIIITNPSGPGASSGSSSANNG